MLSKVPEGWREFAPLGDFVANKTQKWNKIKELPYVELKHIEQRSGRLLAFGRSNEVTSAKNVFQAKDILFGKLRPNLKKYWFADCRGICSTDILVLKASNKLLPSYLSFLVQSEPFLSFAINNVSGTIMPRTSWKRLATVKFSIPPLAEQQRIANMLSTWDKAIEKTEALMAAKEKQFDFLKSRFLKGTIEQYETKINLSNICKIKTGKKDVNEGNSEGKYPFFTCAKNHTYSDDYSFDMEAILLAGNGYIGNPVLYRGKFEAYQRTYILHEFKGVDTEYLSYFLNRSLQKKILQEKQEGAIPYIKLKTLQTVEMILPPLAE